MVEIDLRLLRWMAIQRNTPVAADSLHGFLRDPLGPLKPNRLIWAAGPETASENCGPDRPSIAVQKSPRNSQCNGS